MYTKDNWYFYNDSRNEEEKTMKRSEMYALVMTLIPFACGFALIRMTMAALLVSICILCISCLVMERKKMTIAVSLSFLHVLVLYVFGYREAALYVTAIAVTFSCMQCAEKGYAGMILDRNLYLVAGIFYVMAAVYLMDFEGVFFVMTVYVPVLYRLFVPTVMQKRLVMHRLPH